MRFVKGLLMVVCFAALAGMLGTLVSPKAARAVVNTLVQVANTTSNPVPYVDVNNPAEEPFQTGLCAQAGTPSIPCNSPNSERITVPSVTPDGSPVKRLVVQDVSGICISTNQAIVRYAALEATTPNPATLVALNIVSPLQTSGPFNDVTFARSAHMYLSPGNVLAFGFQDFEPNAGGGIQCTIGLIGYYVTK